MDKFELRCTKCRKNFPGKQMLQACDECNSELEFAYNFEQKSEFKDLLLDRNDMWRYFNLLPINDKKNIMSLGEGFTPIVESKELGNMLGVKLFLQMETVNPLGTFKAREASLVISRCKELGLDNLVFTSTGNTGSAYSEYASLANLSTFFFCPKISHYKLAFVKKPGKNHLILVDEDYHKIKPFAKEFSKTNGLNFIAPLHERTESYSTLAFEQFEKLPNADYFASTVASGVGPIGFFKGHKRLVSMGAESERDIPAIVCIQSEQNNSMYTAWKAGKAEFEEKNIIANASELFEPTLSSSTSADKYKILYPALKETGGTVTEASNKQAEDMSVIILKEIHKLGFELNYSLEKAAAIGFAGLKRLANEGFFKAGETVLFNVTGRGPTAADCIINANENKKTLFYRIRN